MGAELGLSRGAPFAVLGVNSHQYLELFHTAFLGAGVINPINLRLAGPELGLVLADSRAEVVFVDQFFADHLDRASSHDIRGAGPAARSCSSATGTTRLDVGYEDLVGRSGARWVPDEPEKTDPGGPHVHRGGPPAGGRRGLCSTSGPRSSTCTTSAMTVDLDPGRVYLHQTPMFHAASMGGVLGIPAIGGVSVFQPLFDPGPVMQLIEDYHVDWTVAVPTMLAMLLDHPDFAPGRLSSLRDRSTGPRPCPRACWTGSRRPCPTCRCGRATG